MSDEAKGLHFGGRADAASWAKGILAQAAADPQSIVIFDTETTGLHDAEIVQVGLLWGDGTPAMDTLVRPLDGWKIPADATRIHGITDDMVAPGAAPPLAEIMRTMAEIMHGKRIVVYNVAYDFEILLGCLYRREAKPGTAPEITALSGLDEAARDAAYTWLNACASWECAMLAYSAWVGERGRHGGFRWQRLPGGDHSAIGDCRACSDVIKRMAGAEG